MIKSLILDEKWNQFSLGTSQTSRMYGGGGEETLPPLETDPKEEEEEGSSQKTSASLKIGTTIVI